MGPVTWSTRSTAARASCRSWASSTPWSGRAGSRSPAPRSPTTGPTAGATSTSPSWSADRLWLRPSWEPARESAIDLVVDPGQAFGTGAHPTTRLCLEFLLELRGGGGGLRPADRPRHRLRRPRDRRRQARLGSDPRLRPRGPGARGGGGQRRGQRGRTCSCERVNLREQLPALAPTVVANMTAPILKAVAAQLDGLEGVGEDPSSNSGEARPGPPRPPPRSSAPGCCRASWTRSAAAFGRLG